MPAKFDISNLPQAPDIEQNSDGSISDFWISGQSLIKVNTAFPNLFFVTT